MPAIKFPKSNNGSLAKTGNPSSQSVSLTGKFGKSNSSLVSSAIDEVHKGLSSSTDALLTAGNETVANISSFESLTNISSQRPEIIAMVPFQPLYEDSGELTVAGQLFDSLVEYMRALDSSSREFKSSFSDLIKSQNKTIKEESTRIRDVLKTFYDVYRSLSKVRKALTITNEYYDFSPTKLVNKVIKDDGDVDKGVLLYYASKMPEDMNVKNAIKRLRYKDDKIDEFSPTSAFIFLASETRRVLNSHSYELYLNKKKDPAKTMFSFPDRSFYSFEQDRIVLSRWNSSILDGVNFNAISDFTIPEDIQTLIDSARQVSDRLEESSSEIASYLEETLNLAEEGMALESNAVRLAELALPLISQFKQNNQTFSSKLTNFGSVISVFKLISKEIRASKKFNQDNLGSFNVANPPLSDYINSIFGTLNANVDLYQKVTMSSNSIMELAQIPANSNQKVLLFEQTPGVAWSPSCKAGGDYFFDPELLVNFTNTSRLLSTKQIKSDTGINVASNSPDVTIKARIEELSNKVDKTTSDFYKCATEMGLFVTKDEKIFDGEKPVYASTNPEKYLENVWNGIKSHIKIPQNSEIGFKNPALGIKATFAYAGSGETEAANVAGRIYLNILSEIYEQEIEDLKNLNTQLVLSFNRTSKSLDIPSDIKNTILSVAYGIASFLGAVPAGDVFSQLNLWESISDIKNAITLGYLEEIVPWDLNKKFSSTELLLGFYSQAGITPCLYGTREEFGEALRNDGLYKEIVKILKDLKKTLESYVTEPAPTTETAEGTTNVSFAGTRRTKLSSTTINSILYLMFWTICRMVNAASPYIIRYAAVNSFLGGFSGASAITINSVSTGAQSAFNFLADQGLVGSSGLGIQAVSMFVSVGQDINNYSYEFIKSGLSQEMQIESMGLLTVMNTLQVLNKNIKSTKDLFSKLEAAEYANLINYLGDPNKLSFLLKEPQLTLSLSNIEDIYQSFQNFSQDVDSSLDDSKLLFTEYYDKLSHSDKMVGSLKRFFSSSEFKSQKGYNKKIISVGLAQDLLKNTMPKYDFQKQNDIIRLSIYKIDNLNSDIIYKPKSFLFEASRYPSRVYSDYKYNLQSLQSIPTRNYSITPDARSIDKGESAYWNDISNSFGDEYSFLSQDEKEEIIENHAMSTLLENYIRIVTGLIINESAFNLTSDEVEALLKELDVQTNVESFAKATENKLLSKISPGGSKNPKPKVKLSKIGKIYNKGIVAAANNFAKAVAIPSKIFLSYIIQPKKFDRVFNIIFDPEFEVDVKKTRSTAAGDAALARLINEGKIVSSFPRGLQAFVNSTTKQHDEDKTPFDTTVESFFVVLESYNDKKNIDIDSSLLKKIPPSLASRLSVPNLPSIDDPLKKPMGYSFGNQKVITPISIGSILNKLK